MRYSPILHDVNIVRCTVCNAPLFQTQAGISAHMRSHIRKNLIIPDNKIQEIHATMYNIVRSK